MLTAVKADLFHTGPFAHVFYTGLPDVPDNFQPKKCQKPPGDT